MKTAISGRVLTFERFIEFTEQVAGMVHRDTIDKLQKVNAEKRRALLGKNTAGEEEKLVEEIEDNETKAKYLLSLTEEEVLEKFWRFLGLHSTVVVRV
jgi:hypothetical protein